MNNQGNGGIYSKFQQRLRKIRLSRSRKYVSNQDFIQDKVQEMKEIIHRDQEPSNRENVFKAIPEQRVVKEDNFSQVVEKIRSTAKDRNYGSKKVGVDTSKKDSKVEIKNIQVDDLNKHSISKEKVIQSREDEKKVLVKPSLEEYPQKHFVSSKTETELSNMESKEQRQVSQKKNKLIDNEPVVGFRKHKKVIYAPSKKEEQNANVFKKEELLNIKGAEILDKLKGSFEDKLDELDVLESELYFLKKDQDEELVLKKVKEIKNKVNSLIEQINGMIEQYNLYAKNYYIDHVVGIDDKVLVDDIIDYREMLDSFSEEKKFVKEYKHLDEFKALYSKLKNVRDETNQIVKDNDLKIEKFGIRDKKYDEIKVGIVAVEKMNKDCSLEIERQNEYFSNLMEKINYIDRHEYMDYHLRGIGELISQTFRYMGLMMVSPLAGLLPGIGMQAIMTRRMIGNIYRNMRIEEVNHVYYEGIDYDSELNHHLCDVDYTSALLDDTLRDIGRLKSDFMLQYDSKIPGYEDTLKKIEKMEDRIYHNQNKVDIIKKKLQVSKKINDDKMMRIRRLNQGQ